MKLTFLERRRQQLENESISVQQDGNTLRVVEQTPDTPARPWEPFLIRGGDERATERAMHDGVPVRAEIQAKRFNGGRVQEDRYTAMVTAQDGSPSAIVEALSLLFREVDDFHSTNGLDERVILQISLIR